MSLNCHSTLVIVGRNPQTQVLHCSGLRYCVYLWAHQSQKLCCLRPLVWEGKLLGMSCVVFFLACHLLLQGGVLIAEQAASLEFTGWADFPANWWGNLCTNGVGEKSILSEVCFLFPALLLGGRDGRYTFHNGLYQNTRGQPHQFPTPIWAHFTGLHTPRNSFEKWWLHFIPPRNTKPHVEMEFLSFKRPLSTGLLTLH